MKGVRAVNLLKIMSEVSSSCPCHSKLLFGAPYSQKTISPKTYDYAFEMASSTIRYGPGVTKEIGFDISVMGKKNVLVMTDSNLAKMKPVEQVCQSLSANGIKFDVFDKVRVEPTDGSFLDAIAYAKKGKFDIFVAVGGGSVIDTCKVANLYSADPDADFLDYVAAPVGKGKPILVKLAPLIAVPTTSGTGSETTGVSIFDYKAIKAKLGISSRALRPTLGIIDPLHTLTLPERVAAFSGFDVLCHALESYTAIPYYKRSPCPSQPIYRPAYQGSNPISDVWALHALKLMRKYFERSVFNPDDIEARSHMHLASCLAGIGFGNSGVHLCHGMSYPISGNVKNYVPDDYSASHPIIPHGLSVVITAPAVFSFTAQMCAERHIEAAEILGKDVSNVKKEDAGLVLADVLRGIMQKLKIPDGLSLLGYTKDDITDLVKGTLPQKRVTQLAPREQTEEDLYSLFENSLKIY